MTRNTSAFVGYLQLSENTENRSCKWGHKHNGIGVREMRALPFCSDSSENQITVVRSRRGRTDQVQCSFPHFVIGLVLLLLLVTPVT